MDLFVLQTVWENVPLRLTQSKIGKEFCLKRSYSTLQDTQNFPLRFGVTMETH